MSENDLTIRLKALDGRWETVGADRLRGIVPESFQATANEWGSDTCSFVLRRTTGAIHPDLTAFTPCRVEVAGVKVWSGRVKETPTQDGTDEAINVQGEGMQYHLDDDVYDGFYVHTRLGDWRDIRSYVTADLTIFVAAPTVTAGDGSIVLAFPANVAAVAGTRAAAMLDVGSSQAKRLVITWEAVNVTASQVLRISSDDTAGATGTIETSVTLGTGGASSGTTAITLATAHRYLAIQLLQNGATFTPTADEYIRITSAKVFASTAYESVNASTLTADDVVNDAIDRATLLLSSDRSQVQAGTFVIDEYAPTGARSPREAVSGINAYENYETKIDVDDRICFRPRPVAPIYELGEWSGADFSDASTNSGDDIFNRVLVQGTGPDGSQLSVDRSSADQAGVILQPVTSPGLVNPSFAADASNWSLIVGAPNTIARTTTAGEFDSSPAGLKATISTTGDTLVGVTTGTFAKGTRYTLQLKAKVTGVPNPQPVRITFGQGSDAVVQQVFVAIGSFGDLAVSWTPTAARSSATVAITFQGLPGTYFFDTFVTSVISATLVDRQGFRRSKILPVSSAMTTAVGSRLGDLYLTAHKTTPFRGGFKVTGRGGVRWVLGGGSVHPAWLLRDTGQLVRCSHRADPDTGAWTRSGRIATVSYDHDGLTSTVALDEDREGFEALLQRLALVTGQQPV